MGEDMGRSTPGGCIRGALSRFSNVVPILVSVKRIVRLFMIMLREQRQIFCRREPSGALWIAAFMHGQDAGRGRGTVYARGL